MDRKSSKAEVNPWLGLAARVAIGAVLIAAGASKTAAAPEEFAVVIDSYGLVPPDISQLAAVFLPWMELTVGFALIFGYMTEIASALAGCMLGFFALALASTKARGIQLPNCGCFGAGLHMPVWATMIMDTLLLGASALAFKAGGKAVSLDNWTAGRYTAPDGR